MSSEKDGITSFLKPENWQAYASCSDIGAADKIFTGCANVKSECI